MPEFIDSHAHIYADQFKGEVDVLINESLEAGVGQIYMPNIDHSSIDAMLEWEVNYPEMCFPMMGLHPCSVKKDFEKELYLVEQWLSQRKFLAVGEMGIDLYWDKTFFEQQQEAFKIQTGFALKYDLPIVIHCRDSFEETIELVEKLNDGKLKGVFHCFTGDVADAERIIKQGFYLGLGGVTTFKNGGLDKVIPEIDLDHVILETDSPYLAPVPYRGKTNKPAYIPLIAKKIAEYKNLNIEEVGEITTSNAKKLFMV